MNVGRHPSVTAMSKKPSQTCEFVARGPKIWGPDANGHLQWP
jgi:hypothetical protein